MKTYQITQIEHLTRTRVFEVDAISPTEAFNNFYSGEEGKEISDTTEGEFNSVEYNIKMVEYE